MEKPGHQSLTEDEALDHIECTMRRASPGDAPFALVLGAGFSDGLVPTTREVVQESLPLWVMALDGGRSYQELRKETPKGKVRENAAEFWKAFVQRNAGRLDWLELDGDGLPTDIPSAYQVAFNPAYVGALGAPEEARRFHRDLMGLGRPRLNAAHFLLASILGEQPGRAGGGANFRSKAAFSRLILSTNFDPFLQIALQSVNRLYILSDTPELVAGSEALDDTGDEIRLIYVHGSVHRRAQIASADEIRALREKNARVLAPLLEHRGVIVLGHSGWDEAIVDTLASCESFDRRLFWCGLKTTPPEFGALGGRVAGLLAKPSAFYVPISSAGSFMARLRLRLVQGLPRLLHNPVAQVREMLESIDLKELDKLDLAGESQADAAKRDAPAGAPLVLDALEVEPATRTGSERIAGGDVGSRTFRDRQQQVIRQLSEAESLFTLGQETRGGQGTLLTVEHDAATVRGEPDQDPSLERHLTAIEMAEKLGDNVAAVGLCTVALLAEPYSVVSRAALLLRRARARYFGGHASEALTDWTAVITLAGAKDEQVAIALLNRAQDFGLRGEADKALADYGRLIDDLRGIPVDWIARALLHRAVIWGQEGEADKALADYGRLIDDLPGASTRCVAEALFNRALVWGQKGDTDKELADYGRIVDELQGAPIDWIAKALINRALTWSQKGDVDQALTDYSRLIDDLPDAPAEQVAMALLNRAVTWNTKGETALELADYDRLIDDLPGAPVDWVATALNNRALTWSQKGSTDRAMANYDRLIDDLPGAPVEQVATALINRAVTWSMRGETDREFADYNHLIDGLPGAPMDWVATALSNRGWAHYERGEFEAALRDTERSLALDGSQSAAFNLGLLLLANGRDEEALAAYETAISSYPDAIDNHCLAEVEKATNSWLPPERAMPVLAMLRASLVPPAAL